MLFVTYATIALYKWINLGSTCMQMQWTHQESFIKTQWIESNETCKHILLSGVPDFFDRNKILSGGDLSHYQVPHCIIVFFYFVWFELIHHNFQFYFELCTYCNILDIYLS